MVRQTADVVRLTGSTGLTLLGVPAGTLQQVRRWRPGFASVSPSQLALRLGSVHADRFHGVPLPKAGRTIALRIRLRGDPLALRALVREPTGLFSNLDLGEADPGTRTLRARIPAAARGGELAGFVLGLVAAGTRTRPTRSRAGRRRSSRSRRERRRSRSTSGAGSELAAASTASAASDRTGRGCSTSSRTSRRPGSGRASPPTGTRCPRSSRPRSPPRSGRAA